MILLDTHALLWWLGGDGKLSVKVRRLIAANSEPVFVSAASVWEIATKARIGKLPHALPVARDLPSVLAGQDFPVLPISAAHAFRAGWLEGSHGDPFDRMIAAQAILEDARVATTNPAISALGAQVVW